MYRTSTDQVLELRLRVWVFTYEPRIIEVFVSPNDSSVAAITRNPAVLSVNHEARTEALKRYKLADLTATGYAPGRWMYVDFDIDTIFPAKCAFCLSILVQRAGYQGLREYCSTYPKGGFHPP